MYFLVQFFKKLKKLNLYLYSAGENYWEPAPQFEFLGKIATRFSANLCRKSRCI